ncbi:hypothetical protein [Methylobacterium gnaphalii]|uniref:Uncharacterized protein n=1 Tax=Methylobacterium gnaphalii TaxID=1010610 RepID=A0A512JGR1_9HYPH|nr:hypothetical protein [Methylobacterium gnaphalii]GEP09147.1 hypothetical protein MGN01_09920 [Methylobacterium gnaphalii]GJD70444.1 hypothetical protein MMMDOFMJ_3393 [Methylobacterium gnaphalii]GLS50470.1 hypothetical protein GCM10007885_33220 [Methylobacterium gnaphalii]
MHRIALFVATSLLASPAAAGELSAGARDCGGDAFSSAQVIEHRRPRRGPLTAVPDTLCADVTPQQPSVRVDIYANPVIAPQVGPEQRSTPYDTRQPLVGGPPQPRYR